jgi:dihydrofolate synthase/folylpolyglutamate synthase
MPSATDVGVNVAWLERLSPWPADGFGLERMRALLDALGNPQRAFEAVHVVGTNGKTTATRTIEALLLAEGLSVGSTVSPHVTGWGERITIDGAEVDADAAFGRVRAAAEAVAATQFETITAAALAAFADARVDAAVVEAGLGGRYDATNVLRTRVVLLTSVGLDHTDVLGETLEKIAAEKLAVVHEGNIAVLPDDTWASFLPGNVDVRFGGAREAAEAFVGHRIAALVDVAVPGRLERRGGEIRDGAHNPDGVRWLLGRLPDDDFTLCVSILRDKDADAMLALLSRAGRRLVATESSSGRALSAGELATKARAHFDVVEEQPVPTAALRRAHELGEPVLVTGSLYLLSDLAAAEGGGA